MDEIGPTLVGDAVVLKVLEPTDAPTWLAGEDEEQLRWFEMPAASLADVERAIRDWRAGWTGGGAVRHWGIRTRPDGRLVGGVELRVRDDGRANLSYTVFPEFRRRGLSTEAARLASRWGLDHLEVEAIVVIVDERNLASRGVAEAAGFGEDGPAGDGMLLYVFRG